MRYKDNIKDALNYINQNLENDISIEELANISGFSVSHFYKLFASSTGFTVKKYLRNKRLANAAKELVKTDKRVIDIAMDANFQFHEVFTRAFTSLYGITPIQYRKSRDEILLYENFNNLGNSIKSGFKYVEDDININVKIVERKEMYLVGMNVNTTVTDNIKKKTIRSFWENVFLPNSHKIKNLTDPSKKISFEVTNPKTNELYHMACFEVSTPSVPNGMILKTISPQKYAIFTPKIPLNPLEYSSLVTYAYGEWLPISGYQLADNFTFDVIHQKNDKSSIHKNMEVYIPIK